VSVIPELSLTSWAWLALAAALVGFAKTAIGGFASVSVVLFAAVLPAKDSTGALLPLLLCGDLLAVALYRRHGSWTMLLRLVPGVLPGLALGALFLSRLDDSAVRIAIGLILLGMALLQLVQRRHAKRTRQNGAAGPAPSGTPHPALSLVVGVVAGFTTMAANAGGPVMTLYLILAGLPMLQMLGTGAWFFLAVNAAKVPFSAGLDLISAESLLVDLLLVPALVGGAVLGTAVIRRLEQHTFEQWAVALSAVAAGLLLVPT
jgi:uncharacterized membrane protein YfcA